MKLVDMRDLKSLGPKGRTGSTPVWGTNADIAQLVRAGLLYSQG